MIAWHSSLRPPCAPLPQGWLSPAFGLLRNLRQLKLSYNKLRGLLPPEWAGMTSLVAADLSNNAFSGLLPREWSGMRSLVALNLMNNNLLSTIPEGAWGHTQGAGSIAGAASLHAVPCGGRVAAVCRYHACCLSLGLSSVHSQVTSGQCCCFCQLLAADSVDADGTTVAVPVQSGSPATTAAS